MAVATESIRRILARVSTGEIRVPAFQREFVWEPDRVQFLMDSIYKGYPIGTLLFWRTQEKLQFDRNLGPYKLPEPQAPYPIDYVLDGQQRVTSIFAVFQTDLQPEPNSDVDWLDVYFDLEAQPDVQDSQFVALPPGDVVGGRHFPLRAIFNVAEYGALVRKLDDAKAAIIDDLHNRFKEVQIPIETIETEDHSKIAIVFERVNRGGVPLDTFQLLSAWTWNAEFDLRSKFDDLAADLEADGFGELDGEPDLLLRCAAAVISGEATARTVIQLKGADVRDRFSAIGNGVKGAIEFLRRNCYVESMKVLPYKSMLIPLTAFFATDNDNGYHANAEQTAALTEWFWRSCFLRRYSASVDTAVADDIALMQGLHADAKETHAAQPRLVVSPYFFIRTKFNLGAVDTKTYILLLASLHPRSFLSGQPVNLKNVLQQCNRTEFHHVFPKNFLAKQGVDQDAQFVLANFAFLSQTDNRKISNKAPSVYLKEIPEDAREEVLKRSRIPLEPMTQDDYDAFINERITMLAEEATKLCGNDAAAFKNIKDPTNHTLTFS